jgi:hypothetical protein
MGNTAAFFLGSAGNTAVFSQPYGERRRFFFSPARNAGRCVSFFGQRLRREIAPFLPPRPRAEQSRAGAAHRTQAVWSDEFSRHSAPQPGVRTGCPTADFSRSGVCCKPFFICPFVF